MENELERGHEPLKQGASVSAGLSVVGRDSREGNCRLQSPLSQRI